MPQNKIRVGLIGANVNYGWGSTAHIPAIKAVPELDLVALCTSRPETAQESAEQFSVGKAYHDYHEMVQDKDIDLVSIATRVPFHYPMAMAALNAGKHVFCEWPLALNSQQSQEMASLAQAKGLRHGVDLQARCSPPIARFKELMAEGYVGQLLTFRMSMMLHGAMRAIPSRSRWITRREDGGTALTIAGGHSLDILNWCLGGVEALSAAVTTSIRHIRFADTGEEVEVTAPDNVAVIFRLASGVTGTAQVSNTAWYGGGWLQEALGSNGRLIATSRGGLQTGPSILSGAINPEREAVELEVPKRLNWVPELEPTVAAFHTAQLLRRMAGGIIAGTDIKPNFHDGAKLHRLLEAIQDSSDKKAWVTLE